jgi:hypothetical protein
MIRLQVCCTHENYGLCVRVGRATSVFTSDVVRYITLHTQL